MICKLHLNEVFFLIGKCQKAKRTFFFSTKGGFCLLFIPNSYVVISSIKYSNPEGESASWGIPRLFLE